jgi:hypothetical protein
LILGADSYSVFFLGVAFLVEDLLMDAFFGAVLFRGRPMGIGIKASTSDLRTSIRPPILRAANRSRAISLAMACLDTPRIRAASDWEIQASRLSSVFKVDDDTYFRYSPH